jgi:hypothetical protein
VQQDTSLVIDSPTYLSVFADSCLVSNVKIPRDWVLGADEGIKLDQARIVPHSEESAFSLPFRRALHERKRGSRESALQVKVVPGLLSLTGLRICRCARRAQQA